MSNPDEDAAIFKLEVERAVASVWPTTLQQDDGSSKMVPTIKGIAISSLGDLFKVTGTFFDDRKASIVMKRNIVMASVPAAARSAVQRIKASRL